MTALFYLGLGLGCFALLFGLTEATSRTASPHKGS